jgi:ketosteroid isomerase-like protein
MLNRWLALPVAMWLVLVLTGASHGAEPGAQTRDETRDESREAIEREVRRLDAQEADAVLRADFALVETLWADDFIVNNPFNAVGFAREGRVRTGMTAYTAFERVPESVAVRGDTVIVMGREIVVPKAPSANAGRTVHRRYTNVWMKTANGWKLSARHANVIMTATLQP